MENKGPYLVSYINFSGCTQYFKLVGARVFKKKTPNRHPFVLKYYKYTKSLFLNILRFNHLPTKTKTKTK